MGDNTNRGQRCRLRFGTLKRWFTYFDSAPVGQGESLLRIVLDKKDFFNPALESPVIRTAFRPSSEDTDGISLYREDFVSPKRLAKAYKKRKAKDCYIVRLKAKAIWNLKLTTKPTPGEHAGHVVIPELHEALLKSNKSLATATALSLAKLVEKTDVVYHSAKKRIPV